MVVPAVVPVVLMMIGGCCEAAGGGRGVGVEDVAGGGLVLVLAAAVLEVVVVLDGGDEPPVGVAVAVDGRGVDPHPTTSVSGRRRTTTLCRRCSWQYPDGRTRGRSEADQTLLFVVVVNVFLLVFVFLQVGNLSVRSSAAAAGTWTLITDVRTATGTTAVRRRAASPTDVIVACIRFLVAALSSSSSTQAVDHHRHQGRRVVARGRGRSSRSSSSKR